MKIKFIQKIIDKLRNKDNRYIYELGNKILSFEKCINKIDTLILGSSHAQMGYRAQDNEFNLGLSFQDLYYSYNLLNKYQNNRIKNVLLFYSVFSPGYQVIKTSSADKTVAYKVITNTDYQDEITAKNNKFQKLEKPYRNMYKKFNKTFKFDENYRGNEILYATNYNTQLAKERAFPHYKNNQRKNNQTEYVVKMQELANKNNINFIIIIPPVTKEYKSCLPTSNILFEELYKVSDMHCINVLNLYDNNNYEKSDFIDWDHLNLNGANKLTKEINKLIKENIC